jgi:hypothetical protein
MPDVISVRACEPVLTVKFSDGHTMVTVRNLGGWSPSDAIDTFSLLNGDEEVARYQSPYQYPRNTDSRDGFVSLSEGYDVDRVAVYWRAADSYIRQQVDNAGGVAQLQSKDQPMYEAFLLLACSSFDLRDVVGGQVQVWS